MSSIVNAARDLLAIISPMTGTRASGVVTVRATAAKSGTYTWVANVVTVTCAAHGHEVGDTVTLDFTSGSGTPDGDYVVVTVPGTGSFTVALTGSGTAGNVTIGSNTDVYEGEYAIPVLDGAYRDDLVIKVGAGPSTATDGRTYWRTTSAGTDVTFISNLGGARHNTIVVPTAPATTVIAFDPPLDDIASAVLKTSFTGGADATGLGALMDAFMYQQFEGDPSNLGRSNMNRLPGVLIVWKGSEAADGASIAQTYRYRTSSTQTMMRESFDLLVFVERNESDHLRRLQGLYLLDLATGYLTDRVSVDGRVVSSPSGIQVQRRFVQAMRDPEGYVNTYIYGMTLSVMVTYCMTDSRTFNDLHKFILDMVKPCTVAEGGDIAVVGDGLPGAPGMEITNP
jgi:hypothetical protein